MLCLLEGRGLGGVGLGRVLQRHCSLIEEAAILNRLSLQVGLLELCLFV